MEIETRDFGRVEVKEEDIINFPDGVYAFDEAKHFALIAPKENEYPMWLQCTDSLKPCFIVFDPKLFCGDYEITLNEGEKSMLKVTDIKRLQVLCIANVPEDFKDTTVNMKSPIVINKENKLGMQVILPHNFPYRQPIFKKSEQEANQC